MLYICNRSDIRDCSDDWHKVGVTCKLKIKRRYKEAAAIGDRAELLHDTEGVYEASGQYSEHPCRAWHRQSDEKQESSSKCGGEVVN